MCSGPRARNGTPLRRHAGNRPASGKAVCGLVRKRSRAFPRAHDPYDDAVTLLDSLLDAIVRLDGDALVMHVGEKPYVVTTSSAMNAYRGPLAWGQVELSSRVLTPDAVLSMVGQILPDEQRSALDEVGAVEHEIASPQGVADRFTVVAARGGDDIWLELRRHPVASPAPVGQASPIVTDGAPAPETQPAAERASDRSVSTAVGLEEPPSEAPAADQIRETEGTGGPGTPIHPAPAGAAGGHGMADTDDVENYLIPVPGSEGVEPAKPDAPLELVEAEAQHAPTDEDVDAMLAATAASLLAASRKPDTAPAPTEEGSADAVFLSGTFEVVIEEDEGGPQDEEAEDFDLTAELTGMPPPMWSSTPADGEAAAAGDAAATEAAPGPEPVESVLSPALARDSAQAADAEPPPAGTVQPAIEEFETAPSMPAESGWIQREPPALSIPVEPPSGTSPPIEPRVAEAAAREEAEPAVTSSDAEAPEAVRAEDRVPQADVAVHPPAREPASEASGSEETSVDIIAVLPGGAAQVPESSAAPAVAARVPEVPPAPVAPGGPPQPLAPAPAADDRLHHILRVAAERGASTIYAVAQSKPMLRVDGEIAPLENESPLTGESIERFVAALSSQAPGAGNREDAEWPAQVAGIGRVRCVTFRDHRGKGLIVRLIPARAISADHLNLSAEIRELCTLSDGLILVAGPRGSGRSTLLNSFVDLINRTRSEHVVTVETEIVFVHESGRSFVSQREARGDVAPAVHAARREDADVLVVEDVQSPEAAAAVLEAAGSGRLVFASIVAASSAAAVEGLMNLVPEGERGAVRGVLAGALRGVVTQVLVKKASGGRVAARELLLNSPAVAAAVRKGDMPGVSAALDAGGTHGMVALTDALAALVRGGVVHASEACRRAPDRQAILASLAREGVDTSFAERLA